MLKLFFFHCYHNAHNLFFTNFSNSIFKNKKTTQKSCVFFFKSQLTFENL
jgi:hypothetical protein